MDISKTLRDIANVNQAEKTSLMRIAKEYEKLQTENEELKSQKPPCSPTCYHHQTHPCEKCRRISGFIPKDLSGRANNYGWCQSCGALVFNSPKCHKCSGEVKLFCVDIELVKLQAALKAKDELLFAYESVQKPVNPLIAEVAKLREALRVARDAMQKASTMYFNEEKQIDYMLAQKEVEIEQVLKGE